MDLISIIVPVYNVEEYLDECVKSLMSQTYKNIEILLIDDGAKDNSGKICDELAKEDARIIVYHKENGGLSSARNYGLAHCSGEYVCFIDSDDYVESDYCETLYNAITTYDADISLCYENAFNDGEEIRYQAAPITEIIVENHDEFAGHFLVDFRGYICWAWNKMFKREVLEHVKFYEGKVLEDIIFMSDIMQYINKAVWCPKRLVNYRQRTGSIMHENDKKRNMAYIWALRYEYEKIKEDDNMAYFNTQHGVRLIGAIHQVYKEMKKRGDEEFFEHLNSTVKYIYNDINKRELEFKIRIKYWLIVQRMRLKL